MGDQFSLEMLLLVLLPTRLDQVKIGSLIAIWVKIFLFFKKKMLIVAISSKNLSLSSNSVEPLGELKGYRCS